MAPRRSVRAPTTAPVHDSVRVPATAKSLVKSLIRLSKPLLIDLALQWLLEENQVTCAPYLASNRNLEEEVDEDYLWSPAETIEELRLTYNRMRYEQNFNKRYIIDRMLDGDWRRGLSLYQVATIDFQCLSENDKALRWTALKLVPQTSDKDSEHAPLKKKRRIAPASYPTISPSTFLRNLQNEISPIVKAHYHLHRLPSPQSLSIIRVCVADSPYTTPQSSAQSSLLFTDPTRIIFIALPDSCPFIYVSVCGAAKEASLLQKKSLSARMDITSLKRSVLEGIPRALSKPQHRYSLESTSLTARSLSIMLALRGNSGTNAANGIYTIFSEGVVDNSPIDAETTSFAQRILEACEGTDEKEGNLNISELSLRLQGQVDQRTVLGEKSTNALVARNPNCEDNAIDLKLAATARFGMPNIVQTESGSAGSGAADMVGGLDRLQVRLDEDLFLQIGPTSASRTHEVAHHDVDPFGQTSSSNPTSLDLSRQGDARMTLTFQGSNIFLGLRNLVESRVIKSEKLPGWMTGEEAVSGGTVRGGIVLRGKGVGI